MTPLTIETAGLTKTYGTGTIAVHALRSVDIAVERGEFVAVMGPSGSGKSTLMNILGCLDRPTEGTYILDGSDVSRLSRNQLASVRNKKIGFVFQSYNLLPRLTALKNVILPMLYNGSSHRTEKEMATRAAELLALVGLADRMDTIAGFFAIQLEPTGAADPFALRRHALAIIRILEEMESEISIERFITMSLSILREGIDLDQDLVVKKVLGFFRERYKNMMLRPGYESDLIDAILSVGFDHMNQIVPISCFG